MYVDYTNDERQTTNRLPSIPVKPRCPQVTGPRHHDKQQRQPQPQNHTNDSEGNDERQTTRRQSQPQNHTNDSEGNDDRQTDYRQTNLLYVYVCIYF